MKQYKAWTMIELVVALIALIILSAISLFVFKPNIPKNRYHIYATVKNLIRINSMILDEKQLNYLNVKDDDKLYIPGKDWYCLQVANIMNVPQVIPCDESVDKETVNVKLPNGAEIKGLANPWKETPYTMGYDVKNIIIDIDGFDKGVNKIWVDRFPLRILSGAGVTGQIRIVNCASDTYYDADKNKIALTDDNGKSPYCYEPVETIMDDKMITYDVYLMQGYEDNDGAKLVAGNISSLEADCQAYGGNGLYLPEQCQEKNIKLNKDCLASYTCSTCEIRGNCPDIAPTSEACDLYAKRENPADFSCFTIMHKPSIGVTFMLNSILPALDID